jgi:pSer/pThr/pTyr-binding forkhead associated (FHA) protein
VLNQGAVSETTVLNQGVIGETTILISTRTAKEQKTEPILIRMQNNEKIAINKPVFRIGKEKSYVDYFVGNNAAVSRSHANIITRDGQYFIVDTNSKNHTFVNGEMIESNVEVKLNVGDTIMLGNEKFEFRIP